MDNARDFLGAESVVVGRKLRLKDAPTDSLSMPGDDVQDFAFSNTDSVKGQGDVELFQRDMAKEQARDRKSRARYSYGEYEDQAEFGQRVQKRTEEAPAAELRRKPKAARREAQQLLVTNQAVISEDLPSEALAYSPGGFDRSDVAEFETRVEDAGAQPAPPPAPSKVRGAGALSVEVQIPTGGSSFTFKKVGSGAEVKFIAARRTLPKRGIGAALFLLVGVALWKTTVSKRGK